MRKLLALITLSCAMAIGAGVSVTSANAATLTSTVHSLKAEQTSIVEKGVLSPWLSPRLLSPPVLPRLLSPWLLRLRLSSPLLVA